MNGPSAAGPSAAGRSAAGPSATGPDVIVLGGSVAGLLAAQVLAAHAGRVTVIERDTYPAEAVPRVGVPQSRHTHILLTSGVRALEELLPGLVADLVAAGAQMLAVPADVGVWQAGQWVDRSHPSRPVLSASRPLLEHLLRRRVLNHPAVELLPATDAIGLFGDPGRIRGVVTRTRGPGGQRRNLCAGLVVDATGRSSRTPEWLAALGAPAPHEEVLDTGRAYATGVFHSGTPAAPGSPRGFYIVPDADQPYGTIILPVEEDRWMVTLSGPRDAPPPLDSGDFVDFAAGLPHDAPHRWLSTARPVSRPVGFRHTANRRRRYDRGAGPDGLLVIGDAACSLNPVYGQGLSAATRHALALRDALAATGPAPTARHLQRLIHRSSRWPWDVATGADSPMPGATGNARRDRLTDRILDRHLDRVRRRVPGDPVVCEAFRDILFLLAPPRTLLTSPRVLYRSLLTAPALTPPDLQPNPLPAQPGPQPSAR